MGKKKEAEGAANERLMWRSREEDGGCWGEEMWRSKRKRRL